MPMREVLFALAALLALGGCADTLNPAPMAAEVIGPAKGAIERDHGIVMVARAGVWDGVPRNLEQRLTPMLITLKNEGRVPVRIDYSQMMLVTPKQMVLRALPPLQVDGTVTQALTPLWRPIGFAYAPYWRPFVGGAPIWTGPFPHDPLYWNRYGPVLREVNLPTLDMLQRAMPEGVLQPGGQVTGFVYFPGVDDDIEQVRLRVDLAAADDGKRHARLMIPFAVG
ncbi:MAG: hypothetical protein LT102_10120 [Burkholderiaceae bacterium]|nr:hypothetical protein [Burkholderiaceae bacterium]